MSHRLTHAHHASTHIHVATHTHANAHDVRQGVIGGLFLFLSHYREQRLHGVLQSAHGVETVPHVSFHHRQLSKHALVRGMVGGTGGVHGRADFGGLLRRRAIGVGECVPHRLLRIGEFQLSLEIGEATLDMLGHAAQHLPHHAAHSATLAHSATHHGTHAAAAVVHAA